MARDGHRPLINRLEPLYFQIFGKSVRVDAQDTHARQILADGYSAFTAPPSAPTLEYSIHATGNKQFWLERSGGDVVAAEDDGELIYNFEKDLTVTLELLRKDLFFIHGAALEYKGRGCLLIAPSGSGKSTTAWALLHHGFNYLSDELAPLHMETLQVEPYPHALCLKRDPPAPYALPEATLRTSRTLHVPISALPCEVIRTPVPLACVFFVHYDPNAETPAIKPFSAALTAAHLYANGLNQLAHSNHGLAAAARIAQHAASFALTTADLPHSVELIKKTLARL